MVSTVAATSSALMRGSEPSSGLVKPRSLWVLPGCRQLAAMPWARPSRARDFVRRNDPIRVFRVRWPPEDGLRGRRMSRRKEDDKWFAVSLRFWGDRLPVDDIEAALGFTPERIG